MLLTVKKLSRRLPLTAQRRLPREVKVIEISKKEAKRLNKKYRKRDKLTNVLSFRYGKDYGEILVCPEVIRREAREQGNAYKYQMTWMVIHGMLHLAGLHHESSSRAAKRAERLEAAILQRLTGKKNSKFKV